MYQNTTLLLVVLGVFFYVNMSHNHRHSPSIHETLLLRESPDVPEDRIPQEPRRYYDSKYHSRRAMRINVPTRGEPPAYQQVGLLQGTDDSQNVKPLYGRQTYPGANQWNHLTSLDSHLDTKIPIEPDCRGCTD